MWEKILKEIFILRQIPETVSGKQKFNDTSLELRLSKS